MNKKDPVLKSVLLVSSVYDPVFLGGAERVVQGLAEGLVDRGIRVCVVTTCFGESKIRRVLNGVEIVGLPVLNMYNPFNDEKISKLDKVLWHVFDSYNSWMKRAFLDILKEFQPQVVNTHTLAGFSVSIWSAVKLLGIPLVHTFHDQYLLCVNGAMQKYGSNCSRRCSACFCSSRLKSLHLNKVDTYIGVSDFIVDRHRLFLSGVRNKRSVTIYNSYERPSLDCGKEVESGSGIRFGFLGGIHPRKGIDNLIESFLGSDLRYSSLLIAGKGDLSYVESLKKRTEGASNIKWLGFVNSAGFLREVDVLVIPSEWHDTAPLAAVEGMAWGCPIIASDRGGLPELIGEAGWLFEPSELGSLISLLEYCESNLPIVQQVALKAKERASYFTRKRMLDSYENEFLNAVG
ncbi:glycosyltransferase family 4 protein [Pelagicoccus sp. SDUM812002]|uniref:glycosyltransferase family 4 protein n=1 Tax=Pelagicoccus sp. SDUM812002 TaxID=3041266 RepID=UPI00280EAB89|nr:glycosyltransferase family 4 protein [Pelagicoccus sp. SDUM812002]MDQ8188166.1 glycosyltransferase family 4 protein [Pelagicoccus sp. SDUM812002]